MLVKCSRFSFIFYRNKIEQKSNSEQLFLDNTLTEILEKQGFLWF